jgi:hypothetical protein
MGVGDRLVATAFSSLLVGIIGDSATVGPGDDVTDECSPLLARTKRLLELRHAWNDRSERLGEREREKGSFFPFFHQKVKKRENPFFVR